MTEVIIVVLVVLLCRISSVRGRCSADDLLSRVWKMLAAWHNQHRWRGHKKAHFVAPYNCYSTTLLCAGTI